ncbi:copper homeostasis periplasmic binding protein CopC [Variovorax dokdonensis]|uniref:Copper homeostasis periplasmic binding protein CopC n=1 Tax=Variovorax dokdonensis TaxID=344883 RepID=A0ABT7N7A2_9BURK|nr:copper homeostasis periplasmic binding protein CopC [Variovorax dokdonensis]MDM0043760.1 copper homeostasis periplasmic binding protein CopC [Variovorax dokdonensis]
MKYSRTYVGAAIAVAAAMFATAAFAHPELLSSSPADKSEVAAPAAIELKFSETLTAQFSGATLTMTGMPGMPDHGAMKVGVSVAAAGDGKTMVIRPNSSLGAGDYRVDWRAVSSDTHPVTGRLTFKVK